MLALHQLTFICPAVTPEDICILRDPNTPICLQILIAVSYPGIRLQVWDAIRLNEEELGLTSKSWARISCKKTPDTVQIQAYAVRVCAEKIIRSATGYDATDEAITFWSVSVSEYPPES